MKENTLVQRAEIYLFQKGKARHVKRWSDLLDICHKLGIDHACYERTFLEEKEFPPLGRPITEWPEEDPMIGKERLFFCVPPEADFQRIKDVGATLLQSYGMVWQPNQGAQFLDKAEACGLKVLYSIKALIHDKLKAGQGWDRAECQRLVARFNDHPALWGWYLLDEPDAGTDDPKHGVSLELQREITTAFRSWTSKPLVIAVRAKAEGYHLVDFSLYDVVIPDSYVFDGTGECWDKKPLEYLDFAARQISDYFDAHDITTPMMFTFQACDEPAVTKGMHGTRVPSGQIEAQFNVLKEYGLFSAGLGLWAWSGGGYDPMRNDDLRDEIKNLFDKIKER